MTLSHPFGAIALAIASTALLACSPRDDATGAPGDAGGRTEQGTPGNPQMSPGTTAPPAGRSGDNTTGTPSPGNNSSPGGSGDGAGAIPPATPPASAASQ